ncbi:MAG: hypothetical protein F6K16_27305 [Symploca sp. SIO2B6]|nr:hypothetical protein [Symploca sp. SIO2B6]
MQILDVFWLIPNCLGNMRFGICASLVIATSSLEVIGCWHNYTSSI